MVPSGLMIVNLKSKEITFANKEIQVLFQGLTGSSLIDRIKAFVPQNKDADKGSLSEAASSSSLSHSCSIANLWEMLLDFKGIES